MRRKLARFVNKWRTEYAVFTVLCYLAAIPFTFYVFPDNNVWIAILIVFAGLTDSLNTLADRISNEHSLEPNVERREPER
jgi:hypothetical protein